MEKVEKAQKVSKTCNLQLATQHHCCVQQDLEDEVPDSTPLLTDISHHSVTGIEHRLTSLVSQARVVAAASG